ncbi:hypothetical protein ACQKMD_01135 [Viridibacillus sp. NPDC096237]|uniref:hypothetical protein n=1 Tax=Viridibacillus sp. NPDC096237 TaxID=3390721 RepID=UPI003D035B50
MVQYYWNKYNALFKYPLSQDLNYGRSYSGNGTDTTLVEWIASALSGDNIVFDDSYLYSKAYFDGSSNYTFDNPTPAKFSNVVTGTYFFKPRNTGTYCLYVSADASNYYLAIYTVKWIEEEWIKIYSQGSLVQSNIIASESAYTNNARNSDGFWYVRSAAVNTAPTMPGAFMQPTGALEIGDSKAITWGSSTDAEGNLKNYILEASINGGSWNQIGTPTSASFIYTIPTCTSIQFRVKAVDTAGLESGYSTSASLVVAKPKYYYSKYSANQFYNDDAPWTKSTESDETLYLKPKNYTFDYSYNKYSPSSSVWGPDTPLYGGETFYQVSSDGGWLYKSIVQNAGNTDNWSRCILYYRKAAENSKATNYVKGTLIQSGIIAEDGTYPGNGVQSGYWYVKGSRVNESIPPTGPFTAPAAGTVFKPNQSITASFEASTAASISLYEVDYRYNNNTWTPLSYTNALTRSLTTTTDKTLTTLQIRVRAKNTSSVYSDYIYSDVFVIEHNVVPTLTLNTENNKTLYENDSFLIDGSTLDKDNGNIVNVKYQLNGGQAKAITTEISNGTKPIVFSKQLTFKSGKLYDGETALTEALADGVAHQLKVFAEDDQGGKSAEQTRSFFVVPNRAPAIVVNPIEKPTGVIDSDKFPISGVCSDPDGNDVIVSYKINTSLATEIYRGKGGDWTFDVAFSSLKIGENIIIVEVIDSHNFKTSKTIKLNKAVNSTPILNSVARYKIVPPTGTAKGVLLWIQKEKGLNIDAEISMTETGVQEKFVEMPLTNSAPIDSFITEDQFVYEAAEMKENIIVKLNLSRESAEVSDSITLISGVLS